MVGGRVPSARGIGTGAVDSGGSMAPDVAPVVAVPAAWGSSVGSASTLRGRSGSTRRTRG